MVGYALSCICHIEHATEQGLPLIDLLRIYSTFLFAIIIVDMVFFKTKAFVCFNFAIHFKPIRSIIPKLYATIFSLVLLFIAFQDWNLKLHLALAQVPAAITCNYFYSI